MTPARAYRLVGRWVRFYTRQLPASVADRRLDEIRADMHDHIAHERQSGTNDGLVTLSILSRMVRGIPADLAWRRGALTDRGELMKPFVVVLAAALGVAAVAFAFDSPALVLVSILVIAADIVGALVFGLRTAMRGDFVKPFVLILAAALGVTALGVTTIVIGERGDAPGLVLLGVAVITSVVVGAFALGARTTQRSS